MHDKKQRTVFYCKHIIRIRVLYQMVMFALKYFKHINKL